MKTEFQQEQTEMVETGNKNSVSTPVQIRQTRRRQDLLAAVLTVEAKAQP
jgi:hypothetical protein